MFGSASQGRWNDRLPRAGIDTKMTCKPTSRRRDLNRVDCDSEIDVDASTSFSEQKLLRRLEAGDMLSTEATEDFLEELGDKDPPARMGYNLLLDKTVENFLLLSSFDFRLCLLVTDLLVLLVEG